MFCPNLIIALPWIIAATLTSCTNAQRSCLVEQTIITIEGPEIFNVVWRSQSDYNYPIVLSNPACLNKNNELVARACLNGTWTPLGNNPCHTIEKNTLCPPEFTEQEQFCVYTTQPQSSTRKCPYFGASSKNVRLEEAIWMPVERKSRYGLFEYLLPDEEYGEEFSLEEETTSGDSDETTNQNCLIKTKHGLEFSDCDSLYPHVCSYRYNQFLHRCPNGCFPGGLGTNHCFCKVFGIQDEKTCQNLATPIYSYERSVLQALSNDDTCRVGNIQENVDLTLLSKIHGNLELAVSKHGWSLRNQTDLNCAICKVPAISYSQIDLDLKFNPKTNKLVLKIYSAESIFQYDEDDDAVFCFTDATDELKTRVDTEKIWESALGRPLKVFEVSVSEDGPGIYWCEVFQMPEVSLIKSNTVLAHKQLKGNEYSLRVQIHNICKYSTSHCKKPSISFLQSLSKRLLNNDKFFKRFLENVRLFHVYHIDRQNKNVDILLHLSTQDKLPIEAEYYVINRNLYRLLFKQITVVFFKPSLYCLPETGLNGNRALYWKLSSIGTVTTPKQLCIESDGTPVRRRRRGGAEWGKIEGNCADNIKLSAKTELLHSLISSDDFTYLTKNISQITGNFTEFTVLDVRYVAEALSKASASGLNNSEEFIFDITQIIDNLMKVNNSAMQQSQHLLNATDEILDSLENLLISIEPQELLLITRDNFIMQMSKPFVNNITGLALYGSTNKSFLDYDLVQLKANVNFDELDKDELELAVYLPESLINSLMVNLTIEQQVNVTVIIAIFYSDVFFNSDSNGSEVVGSFVISVSVPSHGDFLQTSIPIIFNSKSNQSNIQAQECAFWNYGTASETLTGYWSTLGGDYLGKIENTSLELCTFTHLTNFALLVMSKQFSVAEDKIITFNFSNIETHDAVLTAISDFGCSLSIIGIFGIFLTSFLFQSWREKVGTRILIQLCITILLQIVFFNMANVRTRNFLENLSSSFCVIVGILLHYVIISEFCWMLVAAVLQFYRFVKVIGPMPNRIILKATLVGWGLPFIPIIIVCAVDYKNYSAGIEGFCYPKGMSMYLGVLLPIGLIVLANLIVFIAVIRNVLILSVETSAGHSQAILKRQICLAVLLFFLLGLPWIFGLGAEIIDHDSVLSFILVYLFCLTATLQGFILFVFYVVLDESTRTLWYTFIKRNLNNKLR